MSGICQNVYSTHPLYLQASKSILNIYLVLHKSSKYIHNIGKRQCALIGLMSRRSETETLGRVPAHMHN